MRLCENEPLLTISEGDKVFYNRSIFGEDYATQALVRSLFAELASTASTLLITPLALLAPLAVLDPSKSLLGTNDTLSSITDLSLPAIFDEVCQPLPVLLCKVELRGLGDEEVHQDYTDNTADSGDNENPLLAKVGLNGCESLFFAITRSFIMQKKRFSHQFLRLFLLVST